MGFRDNLARIEDQIYIGVCASQGCIDNVYMQVDTVDLNGKPVVQYDHIQARFCIMCGAKIKHTDSVAITTVKAIQ